MKFLICLLVVVIAAAAGYFAHPSLYNVVEKLRPQKVVVVQTVEQKKAEAAREAAMPKHDQNETKKLLEKLRGQMPANPGENTTPVVASNEKKNSSSDDEIDKKYPMPTLRTIEEITNNWTSVPARAFPRKVKSTLPIDFQMAAGKSTLPPGSDVVAYSLEGGMMTVSRSEGDPLKSTVTLASTDFQETMTRLYNAYVEKRKNDVLKARENAKYARDNPAPPPPPVDEQAKLAGARPAFSGDGKITELMASIAAKEVTEFKAGDIITWNPPEFVMEGGKGYWACTVVVRLSTMFGIVDTDVQAFVANGKVTKWIFAGSKEPVN